MSASSVPIRPDLLLGLLRLGVPLSIRLGRVLSVLDDQVGRFLLFAVEESLQDLLSSLGVSSLGIEGGTTVVRGHTVPSLQVVAHGSPRVVAGCRLRVPDVTSVEVDLARFEGFGYVFRHGEGASCGVDQETTLLQFG